MPTWDTLAKRPFNWPGLQWCCPVWYSTTLGRARCCWNSPEAVVNPFYRMAPAWALYPVVLIATAATVIASQALITGAFSLAMQSVQLGYLPRMEIRHTSATQIGQIYIPAINWILMVACVALVIAFRSSTHLAAAYGVAVTTTMVITTILLFLIATEKWKWSLPVAIAFTTFFLLVDGAFWVADLIKIPHGGWFPLVVGALVFTLMTTWQRGRQILSERLRAGTMRFSRFADQIKDQQIMRVPGTAIFMYSNSDATPPALLHNLAHNKILHEHVILLSVETEEVPRVADKDRVEVHALETGFSQVIMHYGFMENPNVPHDLALLPQHGLDIDLETVSYFLGRERLLATKNPGMAIWREQLFSLMSRNSRNATDFFRLPPDRVVELGSQIEL